MMEQMIINNIDTCQPIAVFEWSCDENIYVSDLLQPINMGNGIMDSQSMIHCFRGGPMSVYNIECPFVVESMHYSSIHDYMVQNTAIFWDRSMQGTLGEAQLVKTLINYLKRAISARMSKYPELYDLLMRTLPANYVVECDIDNIYGMGWRDELNLVGANIYGRALTMIRDGNRYVLYTDSISKRNFLKARGYIHVVIKDTNLIQGVHYEPIERDFDLVRYTPSREHLPMDLFYGEI